MALLRQLVHGWRTLTNRHGADRDTQDEAAHYLQELTADLESRGHPAAEARRLARLEVGSALALREQVREAGWENTIAGLLDDVRYAVRRLLRTPGFTAATVLTLALGLGSVTTIYCVLDAVLLRPLPYPHADRLVLLRHAGPGINLKVMRMAVSLYFTYREEAHVFDEIALWNGGRATVTGLDRPEEARTLFVTHRFLDVLSVQPALGRALAATDDEPGSMPTVILADSYWKQRFGADPGVLGRRLLVNGTPHTVIGVLPAWFEFLDEPVSLMVPMRLRREQARLIQFGDEGVARLKSGVTLAQATADLARCIRLAPAKFPLNPGFAADAFANIRLTPTPRPLKEHWVGDVRPTLWVLMGAVALLLLVACANVANLLLVRADGRRQELAVRTALGAQRSRIARELLAESLVLSLSGGALGLVVCAGGLRLAAQAYFVPLPRLASVSMDTGTWLLVLAVATACGLLFGLVPVLRYAKPKGAEALQSGGRSLTYGREHRRAQQALVVVQVALALVLLVGSGLMLRTFQALQHVDPGFTRPDQVQVVRVSVPATQVKEPEAVMRLQEAVLRGFERVTGVQAVALATSAPMDGANDNPVLVEGQEMTPGTLPPVRRMKDISPGWAAALGSRFVAGRDFTWQEIYALVPVALVSEKFARELWGMPQAALGKRIRLHEKEDWREVVGVVADLRDDGLARIAPAMVYWPLMRKAKNPDGAVGTARNVDLLVRSPRAGSIQFVRELEQALQGVNANLPLANVRTLEAIYRRSLARTSLALVLLGVTAAMALLLGFVGIYGVVAYSVAQRRREIGIRIALGASLRGVTNTFVREGLVLLTMGSAFGLLAALAGTQWMRSLLFGVSAADPATYAAVLAGLALAVLLASWLPARRAARVDPLEALRVE